MNKTFTFILADTTAVTDDFSVIPVSYPIASGSTILTGDPIFSLAAPATLDLADNVYKIELNRKAANTWYINTSGSNKTSAAEDIVSGSRYTTLAAVTFRFADHNHDPLDVKNVLLTPKYKNIAGEYTLVLNDTIQYTTNGTGSFVIPSLVTQVYDITFVGDKKKTTFSIWPTASCNASECIVTSTNVARTITPQNQATFGYTATASDARYLLQNGTAVSASHALTANHAYDAEIAWTANEADNALTANSASYAATASNALNATNATSAQNIQIYDSSTSSDLHPITFGPFDDGGIYPGVNNIGVGNLKYRPSTDTLDVSDIDCNSITASILGSPSIDIIGNTLSDSPTLSAEFLLSTGWASGSLVPNDWSGSFENGFAHTAAANNTSSLTQSKPAVISTKYQIVYTVTGRTAGSFDLSFGGQSNTGITANGTFGPTALTTAGLSIVPTATFNGTCSFSIKSITGISNPVMTLKNSGGVSTIEIRTSSGSLNNTFIGNSSGRYTTTGNNNSAIGFQSLYSNTTGFYNSAFGYQSLFNNTTGLYNSAFGYRSLYSNTTGERNSAIGYASLYSNTTGYNNSAIGSFSLYNNTTGYNNSAIGYQSLFSNTTGYNNSAVGYASLYANTTGLYNSAIGYQSLYTNTTGQNNSAIGYQSLYTNTTGQNNSAIGYQSGRYIADGATANVSGSNNVFIGVNTKSSGSNDSNEIVIGYLAIGKGSNTVVLGNDSITKTYLKGQVSASQYTGSTMYIADKLGIGTSAPTRPIDCRTAIGQTWGTVSTNANAAYWDSTSAAAGVGGAFALYGNYLTTNGTLAAGVKASKTNATANNWSFDLAFATRLNGSSELTEAGRFTDSGSFLVGTTVNNSTNKVVVNGNISASAITSSVVYGVAMGQMFLHDNTTALSIPTGTTYQKITTGYTSSLLQGVSFSTGSIMIQQAGIYDCAGQFSFTADTNNVVLLGTLFVNDIEQDQIHFARKIVTGADIGSAGFTGFFTASANQQVDVRLRHDYAGTVAVTTKYANLNIKRIG